ncbi:uncharacterized protein F54H12.2-like [Apostichopus japonicus]|uniref:uncharacterized protein F54H12.2-like n=1 Tax=Stichopus japonicus TaxID=307972 RepID=UPI003AB3CE85
MTTIHPHSCECSKSEMDIFSVPPTQIVIDRGAWEKINPIAGLSQLFEFEIPGTGDQYLDLEETQLFVRCKITKSNGGALVHTGDNVDSVGPVNYPLHALFKQVDVSLNGQQISDSSACYPYRSYMEALLNYGREAKTNHLSTALYQKDTPGHMEDSNAVNGSNQGLKTRAKHFKDSVEVELMGRLHCDIFHMDRYFVNGVTMKLKLIPNNDAFVLMTTNDAAGYRVQFTEVALYIRRVTPSATMLLQHAKVLASGTTAKYPINRVQVRTKAVQAGSTNVISDHLWLGQLPRRLILGIVKTAAFNGHYAKNPFNFHHFKVNEVSLRYAGRIHPSEALKLRFNEDGSANQTIRAYDSLFTALHKKNLDEGIDVTRNDYEKGYTLYAFDFTPDLADGAHYNRKDEGTLDLTLRFDEALTESVMLILYAEFDNLIEIDQHGNVSFDFIR